MPHVSGGGGYFRRLHPAATSRIESYAPGLAVFVEPDGIHLRQKWPYGEREIWRSVAKYPYLDEGLIENDVRRMTWWARRGGLLEEIDKNNEYVAEAHKRRIDNDTEEAVKYYYDAIVERHHFGVNGFRK